MTNMESKEWVAEMPLPEEARVNICRFLRSDANDRSRLATGASYEWQSRCQAHLTDAANVLSELPDLIARVNTELAKVRAERDSLKARIAEIEET